MAGGLVPAGVADEEGRPGQRGVAAAARSRRPDPRRRPPRGRRAAARPAPDRGARGPGGLAAPGPAGALRGPARALRRRLRPLRAQSRVPARSRWWATWPTASRPRCTAWATGSTTCAWPRRAAAGRSPTDRSCSAPCWCCGGSWRAPATCSPRRRRGAPRSSPRRPSPTCATSATASTGSSPTWPSAAPCWTRPCAWRRAPTARPRRRRERSDGRAPASVTAGGRPPLLIRALGGFQVLRGGAEVPEAELGGERGRELLAALLCAGRAVRRDQLLAWLWPGEAPEAAGPRARRDGRLTAPGARRRASCSRRAPPIGSRSRDGGRMGRRRAAARRGGAGRRRGARRRLARGPGAAGRPPVPRVAARRVGAGGARGLRAGGGGAAGRARRRRSCARAPSTRRAPTSRRSSRPTRRTRSGTAA